MISVTACAGDAKQTAAATAASRRNLGADFTIEPIQSVKRKTPIRLSRAVIERRTGRFNPRQAKSKARIDDTGDAGRIAILRRLLLRSIEPFLPARDIIIRG
jgi:hypothetical protein